MYIYMSSSQYLDAYEYVAGFVSVDAYEYVVGFGHIARCLGLFPPV